MAGGQVQLTQESYDRLQKELAQLHARRAELRDEVALTRSYGDLRENVGYHAAREALSITESQVKAVEDKLAHATIVAAATSFHEVALGVPCTVRVEATGEVIHYTVVEAHEVKLVDDGISASSPIGEALLYARIGDECLAETPRGLLTMTVLSIG
ncbi:MAG: GreA/GreB family elongation factor [Fimbriimonadaceae bacterium]|nr:GreA/GreB family elongation factor [Fimbriimonadaceae bacterium]